MDLSGGGGYDIHGQAFLHLRLEGEMEPKRASAEIKGVVFDMDGTLTISPLDFSLIRAEAGVPPGRPILEFIDAASEAERARVQAVLDQHEARAAQECTLRDGAREVTEELRRRGIKMALLTRNSAASVRTVVERFGLRLDCCVSREDAEPKPSPAAVLRIADALGVRPEQLLVVGDYVFDVQAGMSAGARTAFLRSEGGIDPPPEADVVLDDLRGLLDLLPGGPP